MRRPAAGARRGKDNSVDRLTVCVIGKIEGGVKVVDQAARVATSSTVIRVIVVVVVVLSGQRPE
jgi:hypothetical protein